ncbi:MAG: hypothetical protein ACTSRS_13285 [Candidatus Helarchaeota archaeon]
MKKREAYRRRSKITDFLKRIQDPLIQGKDLEELDLVNLFFQPLQKKLKSGEYNLKIVRTLYSATGLLNLKVQELLDQTLQRNASREVAPTHSKEEVFSEAIVLARPIQPLAHPLLATDITKAYIELILHRKRKRTYQIEPRRMEYNPVEIEPVSIEEDKEDLLSQIKQYKRSSIELSKLLKVKSWQEVTRILSILLHLAHEGKIQLLQDNFPHGRIIIINKDERN